MTNAYGVRRLVPAAISAVLFTCGCGSKQKDEGFYFIAGSADPGIDIYVNGNPTNGGNALTLFVVEGKNTIEFRGDFSEGGYTIQVYKAKGILDQDAQKVIDETRDASVADEHRILEFEEKGWWRWAWQDAEELGELTPADRDEIFQIYDEMCELVENAPFSLSELLQRKDVVFWSESEILLSRTREHFDAHVDKVPPKGELVFKKVDREDVRVQAGKQIVMLTPSEGKLVYLGPKERDDPPESGEMRWTFSYGFSEMFFAKIDGEWKFLMPVP